MDTVPQSLGVTGQSASAKPNASQTPEGSSYTANLSNTVCVSATAGEWFTTTTKAFEEFSSYGDVARIDLSLMVMLKCVLVTFFDVRSSQQVLADMVGRTEPFPPSAHDCRIVRVNMPAFFEKMPMLAASGGFAHFGEVASISMSGGDATVEFYDMRAAQMLLAAAGSTASPCIGSSQGAQAEQMSSALGCAAATRGTGLEALGSMLPGGSTSLVQGLLGKRAYGAGNSEKLGPGTPPPGLVRGDKRPSMVQATQAGEESTSYTGFDSSPMTTTAATGTATSSNSDSNEPMNAERMVTRPNRSKVTTKEFSKYDIDPNKIQSGHDPRTTVMVRNLTGNKSRKDFLSFLERCDLNERYTFFYMPCKEHRNVPAGFAFVNFVSPSDVHKLYVLVKSGFWREVMTNPNAKVPAVSYARFQGHEELTKHFNSSAVLHEQDPEKRPIFRLEVLRANKDQLQAVKDQLQAAKEHFKEDNGAGAARTKTTGVHAKKASLAPGAEPATVSVGDGHFYASMAAAENEMGGDLQAALAKGAQEIAAILRRQEFQ